MASTDTEGALISLTVNGQRTEIRQGTTLAALLAQLDVHPRMVVVEHNRVIVRDRETFSEIVPENGDTLELVHFVGGG